MEGDREEEHSGFHSHRVEEVPKVVVLLAAMVLFRATERPRRKTSVRRGGTKLNRKGSLMPTE